MLSTVHLAVYDALSDWETGYAVAAINDPQYQRERRFEVRTVGLTRDPVVTMGGVRIQPDLALGEVAPQDSAMLLLAGSHGWDRGASLEPMAQAAGRWLQAGVPVAAICGATAGLARAGLLDDRRHTSNAAMYLEATGYAGAAHYVDAPAVTDGPLITASGVHPVPFAHEVLAVLGTFTPEVLEAWTGLYRTGEPSWFFRLMEASGA